MKTYIKTARESVSTYNIVGDKSGIELEQVLAVLMGSSASYPICSKLSRMEISELVDLSIQELVEMGLTPQKAIQLQSAFIFSEMAKKVESNKNRYTIRSPEDASAYLMSELSGLNQEHFVMLMLNVKNEVIGQKTVFIGSLNSSIVHPREVYKEALKKSSASIIICHNHPSGNPSPSPEDIEVTKRLMEAGMIMGIELLDHIIVGNRKFVSLKEKGYM